MWKSTEFMVLLHRDYKDVFILGGTDDIQVRNKEINTMRHYVPYGMVNNKCYMLVVHMLFVFVCRCCWMTAPSI